MDKIEISMKPVRQDVALVLSSGGPRGFAYIGAIEELERRGYHITSIAGTSMGSLIGGIYATGKLDELKEWLFDLNAWKVFDLMDISISKNHIVKGDKIIEAIEEIIPDIDIKELNIPFKAVATDLYTGEEVVYSEGKLYDAIRASISIPTLFRPVKQGMRTLIDGGIANTLPINRVDRNGKDILVAFDVNDINISEMQEALIKREQEEERRLLQEKEWKEENRKILDSIRNNDTLTIGEKMKLAGIYGRKILSNTLVPVETSEFELGESYFSLLDRTFSLMNHTISELILKQHHPDIVVRMPFDAYGEISDYAKAKEISTLGRELMKEALDRWER